MSDEKTLPQAEPGAGLARLRSFTPARIALGRVGTAQPTAANLRFALDHARARDAVHAALDFGELAKGIEARGLIVLRVESLAENRAAYLRRPDLGRRLSQASRVGLQPCPCDVAIIAADGLSAIAISLNLLPLLDALLPLLRAARLSIGPLALAEQGRVALGDEIGETLGARLTIVLIGERPGLSAADSLGAYITYAPRIGTMDSNRNCISNIRPGGLAYDAAARQLLTIIEAALRLEMTGVRLSAAAGPAAIGAP